MSVSDEVAFPWLSIEKNLIRAASQKGIPMVGICLGARLIAGALGVWFYPNAHPKIGGYPGCALVRQRPMDAQT